MARLVDRVKMDGYLPVDRRDLQPYMVNWAVANVFTVGVRLRLWNSWNVNEVLLNEFSRRLFRLVKRRHTHLWDKI